MVLTTESLPQVDDDRAALVARALGYLACPETGEPLRLEGGSLVSGSGRRYAIAAGGIPLFAATACSEDARRQERHYDRVAHAYTANLSYPHTQEYLAYLDRRLLDTIGADELGVSAEICCGHGEAFGVVGDRMELGIGIDISTEMLKIAAQEHAHLPVIVAQGDATMLPVASDQIDTVFMLGGIHHVSDRRKLFSELFRILKPGGRLYWREPVSDFFLWRLLRAIIYRLSPALDAETEEPLRYATTVPPLEEVGFTLESWRTYGFLGFCVFMNSDVLVFNRAFRLIPGIRTITRAFARLDDWALSLPGMRRKGLQVVGLATKPPATR